jgi:hypothetical protein
MQKLITITQGRSNLEKSFTFCACAFRISPFTLNVAPYRNPQSFMLRSLIIHTIMRRFLLKYLESVKLYVAT